MTRSYRKKSWEEFEYNTKRGLEALDYQVERDIERAGSQIDLYAELKQPLNVHRLVVECKNFSSPVGVKTIRELAAIVSSLSKPNMVYSGLVVSRNGFTRQAKNFANSAGLWLLTLDELFELSFDPTPLLKAIIQEFESEELSSTYVDLTCSISEIGGGTIYKPVEKFLDKFFPATQHNGLVVLGNFGTGKTSLCRHYTYLLAKRWLDREKSAFALPLYINLRDVKGLNSLNDTFHRATKAVGASLNVSGVKLWLKNGKTLLMLDGFDEMATGMDGMTINSNLRDLNRFCEDNSVNVMLTCRTHFFKKRVEEKTFGDLLRLYIRDWGKTELTDYVKKARPKKTGAVLEIISKTYNLEELSKTPIFLNMIVDTVRDLGSRINQAKLYQIYTDRWIDGQIIRSRLSPEEKRLFMEELAYVMYRDNLSHISYVELPTHIENFFSLHDHQALRGFDQDIRTCTFLVRDDSGRYHFVHRSYMEFFVASHLASLVKENKLDKFSRVQFSKEVAGFFANYFESDVDLLLKYLVRGHTSTIRANIALSIGQLQFSERLQNALLLALTTENKQNVLFAIIDAIIAFETSLGIHHIVKAAHRLPSCTVYCVNALSHYTKNEEVRHLIHTLLKTNKDRSTVIPALIVIAKNNVTELIGSLNGLLVRSWWHSDDEVAVEVIRAVDSIGDSSSALKLMELSDEDRILKDRQGEDSERIENPYKPIFNAACESLTKRFSPEVSKLANLNFSKGLSYKKNEGKIRRVFGFFVDDDNLKAQLRNLYEFDTIKTKTKRSKKTRKR